LLKLSAPVGLLSDRQSTSSERVNACLKGSHALHQVAVRCWGPTGHGTQDTASYTCRDKLLGETPMDPHECEALERRIDAIKHEIQTILDSEAPKQERLNRWKTAIRELYAARASLESGPRFRGR
jgi:hypothetical protein